MLQMKDSVRGLDKERLTSRESVLWLALRVLEGEVVEAKRDRLRFGHLIEYLEGILPLVRLAGNRHAHGKRVLAGTLYRNRKFVAIRERNTAAEGVLTLVVVRLVPGCGERDVDGRLRVGWCALDVVVHPRLD